MTAELVNERPDASRRTPPEAASASRDDLATHRRPTLRILQIAPVWLPVPPPAYGGIEWIVHWLGEGLRDRGHEVEVVTVGSSRTSVPKHVTLAAAPPRAESDIPAEALHALATLDAVEAFRPDVVHDHTLLGALLDLGVPHILTTHGPTDGFTGEYYTRISRRTPLVAISDAQRRALPDANWLGTVHNAIDVDAFPFTAEKDDYLLFLGRVCEDKGTHLAIRAARDAGRRLIIAGRVAQPHERRYFAAEIEPSLGDGIEYVGEADRDAKRRLLAGARAVLCPLLWDEPFGLVMIEALACGTPVIAFPRGAAPEIVEDGVTGALVRDASEMAEAIRGLDVDPRACRDAVATRFDVPHMVEGYEALLAAAAAHATRVA